VDIDGDDHKMVNPMLHIWKRRKRKTKWAQGKGITIGPFWFGDQDTIESMITFRIDSRTIKRGETCIEMRLSKCH